jgi:hypothetical protein
LKRGGIKLATHSVGKVMKLSHDINHRTAQRDSRV